MVADQERRLSRPPPDDFAPCLLPLGPFRAAVSDLIAEIENCDYDDAKCVEHVLGQRLDDEEFTTVLDATPDGWDTTVARLFFDVRNYEPIVRNATGGSLAALVRISLLAQIDAVWWGEARAYEEDSEVLDADDLVDLNELAACDELSFRYRNQATTLVARAARSAERRALPGRRPRTAGLLLPVAKPEVVGWLNDVAEEFAEVAPDGTPPLWVTSVARSIEHQRHLRALGYIALLPSAHCVGYAADIEMKWYRRFHAHRLLRGLLLDRQRSGEVNVIDEGQAWHVCLRPDMINDPRWMVTTHIGS